MPADQRDRLERIARYALRPPVAQDRLAWTDAGQVRLELRRSWSDGTTHLLFDPVELLERLAALTPRPRVNLILYHGVLAPRAAWRARVVQFGAADGPDATQADNDPEPRPDPAGCSHGCNYLWAELMRRSLGLDVLACPRCGGRLTLIALIDDPAVIGRMLQHLKLPTEVPEARPHARRRHCSSTARLGLTRPTNSATTTPPDSPLCPVSTPEVRLHHARLALTSA